MTDFVWLGIPKVEKSYFKILVETILIGNGVLLPQSYDKNSLFMLLEILVTPIFEKLPDDKQP